MIRIGLLGCEGRMGRQIAAEIQRDERCRLTVAASRSLACEQRDASGVLYTPNLARAITSDEVDVVVDFTVACMTANSPVFASEIGKPFMSGTTGLSSDAMTTLALAADIIPVLYAPNASCLVTVMKQAVTMLAKELASVECSIGIIDDHHKAKLDAPSGTALMLKDAIQKVSPFTPQIESIRAGDTVGAHTVTFQLAGETLSIRHTAEDRRIFARDALLAAQWLHDKPAGLYDMDNFLNASRPTAITGSAHVAVARKP